MNKKFLLFLLVITIAILYLFSVEKLISKNLNTLNSSIKSNYINVLVLMNESVNKYFNQLDYIEQLKNENIRNLQYKLLYEKKSKELQEINKNIDIHIEPKLIYKKVRVLSYFKFNDHSKVILDKKIKENKISALITYDGFSAGIVVNKNNKSIAYLNQHKRCNYTVFIGETNTPGITSGIQNDGNIIVKYVPIWKDVKIDDEVITSSMDSIFPYGVKVGKVIDIIIHENTKNVIVSPYADTLGNRDYYLYSKKIEDNNTSN
ncbi:MAG: rod shape-determining protein MreC [Campylobacterota bacterium]|nr:rod shape-determining protein MreC [Campylobacterota bacterium]